MAIAGVPSTAARDTKRKDGHRTQVKMAASTTINKGALVAIVSATGLAVPFTDAAGQVFAGVAYETVTSLASGNYYINVEKYGCHLMNAATGNTFVQANVLQEVYANSDNQVTVTAGDVNNTLKVGRISDLISGTQVYVRIDGYC